MAESYFQQQGKKTSANPNHEKKKFAQEDCAYAYICTYVEQIAGNGEVGGSSSNVELSKRGIIEALISIFILY